LKKQVAAQELLGLAVTSAPSEQVFCYAGEWRMNLCYSHAFDYENESTFGNELN